MRLGKAEEFPGKTGDQRKSPCQNSRFNITFFCDRETNTFSRLLSFKYADLGCALEGAGLLVATSTLSADETSFEPTDLGCALEAAGRPPNRHKYEMAVKLPPNANRPQCGLQQPPKLPYEMVVKLSPCTEFNAK